MAKNYKIWNKQDSIITPSGKIFTADEWMEKYPVAKLENIVVICATGDFNGAIFATLGQLIQEAENHGCDFSDCTTNQEKLDRYEEFEETRVAEATANTIANEELTATSLASIAASLDYQNMMTLEDEELVEEEVV